MIHIIIILIILFNSGVFSKDHYIVEEIKDSEYIGKVYNIKKPILYVKNLGKCNNLEKYVALNTSCLFIDKSEFKIEDISNNCHGCLSKKTMPVPLRLELKENTKLKVVGVFSSSINYWDYKFFGGNKTPKHFLFIDQNGKYIEMPFYNIINDFGIMSNEINIHTNKIMEIKNSPYISKKICYYKNDHENYENKKNKVIKMISDFELSDSIKISESNCNKFGFSEKSITIKTKNIDDFLTIYYFKESWQIYGDIF